MTSVSLLPQPHSCRAHVTAVLATRTHTQAHTRIHNTHVTLVDEVAAAVNEVSARPGLSSMATVKSAATTAPAAPVPVTGSENVTVASVLETRTNVNVGRTFSTNVIVLALATGATKLPAASLTFDATTLTLTTSVPTATPDIVSVSRYCDVATWSVAVSKVGRESETPLATSMQALRLC